MSCAITLGSNLASSVRGAYVRESVCRAAWPLEGAQHLALGLVKVGVASMDSLIWSAVALSKPNPGVAAASGMGARPRPIPKWSYP
jgi:hypothetical protein